MSNDESLRSVIFIKSAEDILLTFNIPCSIFDIRFFGVFSSNKLVTPRPEAGLTTDTLSHLSWYLPFISITNLIIVKKTGKCLKQPCNFIHFELGPVGGTAFFYCANPLARIPNLTNTGDFDAALTNGFHQRTAAGFPAADQKAA